MDAQQAAQAAAVADRPTEATFTKWMVGDGPEMAGVVGGIVGDGAFSGTVFEYVPGPKATVEARYRFTGAEQSFTALVHIEETGGEATVVGVVTDGWGKGSKVQGTWTEIACDHDGVTTDCYRGSLRVLPQ